MSEQTDIEIDAAVERTRQATANWRSTPEGEADYQATVKRVFSAADRWRADTGTDD